MDPVIGIDLGTTNSAAAFLGPDGPVIIPNAVGGRLTPSVVGVDESGKVLVGAARRASCRLSTRTGAPTCSSGTWALIASSAPRGESSHLKSCPVWFYAH